MLRPPSDWVAQAVAAKLAGEAPPPEAEWMLWYRKPARKWEEALPVGNGRMGARRWDPPLKNLNRDVDKLKPRTFSVNRDSTMTSKEGLEKLFGDYNSTGITGIIDRNASRGAMELYQDLLGKDKLSVRVASEGTRERLEALGETVDNDGWVSVGALVPNTRRIDLDAAFPGQAIQSLRFDGVRLEDDPNADSVAGPDVGADIDAVGAVTLAAPTPDLAVVDLVTPAEGLVGQPYAVDWSIRNVGDAVANLPWSDRLWISTSSTSS